MIKPHFREPQFTKEETFCQEKTTETPEKIEEMDSSGFPRTRVIYILSGEQGQTQKQNGKDTIPVYTKKKPPDSPLIYPRFPPSARHALHERPPASSLII